MDKLSPVPLSPKLREQLKKGEVELRASGSAEAGGVGIVRYFSCEPGKDKATVQWLLNSFPDKFQKCPSESDIGVSRFKAKEGTLQSGEVELKKADKDIESIIKSMKRTLKCVKAQDKETVTWLLKEHSNIFYECPKKDEVGIVEYRKDS
jgi:hypothetical protein